MKIVGFYYPFLVDDHPKDPTDFAALVHVVVGGENATLENFDYEYAFQIYTLNYLARLLHEEGRTFIIDRSVIIVDRFEDSIIKSALEAVLDDIDFVGIRQT